MRVRKVIYQSTNKILTNIMNVSVDKVVTLHSPSNFQEVYLELRRHIPNPPQSSGRSMFKPFLVPGYFLYILVLICKFVEL